MDHIVETHKLYKSFGSLVAVGQVDLRIVEGEVFGLIGPNGAGKSTILKMLATILRPTAGRALVAGHDVALQPMKVRALIGYMPDVFGVYDDMLVDEYLRFFAAAYGIRGKAREKVIDKVLDLTSLAYKRNANCSSLSRGMSQRLSLARVLLHDPQLLLLDEPASGLDPRARIELKELILALKKMGKTILISSHILSELEEMCDSIAIIECAKLVYNGPIDAAMAQVSSGGRMYRITVTLEPEQGHTLADLLEVTKGQEYVEAVREADDPGTILVRFKPNFSDFYALNAELVGRQWKVLAFSEERVVLEDAFLELTKGIIQ